MVRLRRLGPVGMPDLGNSGQSGDNDEVGTAGRVPVAYQRRLRSVGEPARHSVAFQSNHSCERRLDSLAAVRGDPVEMRASGRDPGSTPTAKVRFLVVFLLDDGVVSGSRDTGMGAGWNCVRGGHEGLCEICNNNGHGHTGPDTMIFVVWSGDGHDLGRTGRSKESRWLTNGRLRW
ncbi:uncharacterized protein M6B38_285550 [Iris pallida]|uniref:Uncharacterized protein n=1 Tax=Iris pallida TaxID=29817 RepID=A0AAX6HZ08_IRIPA|nr:uncharacterized protein M6B38_285550 [Iris pallida]